MWHHTHTQCAPLLLLGKHRCDNLTRARLSAAYPAWPTWQLQRCVPAANPRLRVVEVHRLCPSRSPKGKMSQTFRSGDLGGHLQNTWSFCLARPLRCCEVSAILHFTAVWRRVGKLKISWVNVSTVPYLWKYSSKFWFYNYLKSRSVFVFTLYLFHPDFRPRYWPYTILNRCKHFWSWRGIINLLAPELFF